MKPYLPIALLMFSGILAGTGCGKETEIYEEQTDFSYFPLSEGAYFIYKYDSVWVDCVAGRRDTFHWEYKEEMDSFYTDASGKQAMLLKVYRRNAGSGQWGQPRIYSLQLDGMRAMRIEENVRYIKLQFPLAQGKEWDGNLYNTLDWGSMYKITELHTPWGGFDSTVHVVQKDQQNLLERKLFTERYASGVGLVYREAVDVTGIIADPMDPNYCEQYLPPATPWNTVPIMQRIKLGYVVQKTLLEYQF